MNPRHAPSTDGPRLNDYGWGPHFQAQMRDEDAALIAARVIAVHRDALEVAGPDADGRIAPPAPREDDAGATVGDWLLLERATRRAIRVLERKSAFKRKAAGTGRRVQLIAANVDTLLVVTSANQGSSAIWLWRRRRRSRRSS